MKLAPIAFFSGFVGALLGSIGTDIASDYAARAPGDERAQCTDRPDMKAYMMRLPGEAHSVETCQHVMRFGNPNWIPLFSHPLKKGE